MLTHRKDASTTTTTAVSKWCALYTQYVITLARPSTSLQIAGRRESVTPLLLYSIASGTKPDMSTCRPCDSLSVANLIHQSTK